MAEQKGQLNALIDQVGVLTRLLQPGEKEYQNFVTEHDEVGTMDYG